MTSSVWIVCILSFALASGFDLPDLRSVFGSFYDEVDEVDSTLARDRVKRQDPGIGDESPLHYEVRSSRLPPSSRSADGINKRYMPTLGNGHIATTVYDDGLFLNGLYSGVGSDSHRAKIPARVMSRIRIANQDVEDRARRKYILNAKEGYFMETIDCDFAFIKHKIYIHKWYIRVLVSDISWKKKSGDQGRGGGKLILNYPSFNTSDDIIFSVPRTYKAHFHRSGTTRFAEEGAAEQTVHVFTIDPVNQLAIQGSQDGSYIAIMAADRQEAIARTEFDECLRIIESSQDGNERLFRRHAEAWKDVWDEGNVEMEGDTQLAKITTFAQYYMLSSLPTFEANQPPQHKEFLYGIGRGSLAKGIRGKDYQGHVMWDSEMYVLPAILFFHPELAKRALRYRSEMADSAAENAKATGATGYKYPFRSAYTGREVGSCPECDARKLHVSGAVSWGIRQYFSATRDRDYLVNDDYRGCDITREIARFYASHSKYDPETARYNIKGTTGPDENYPNRDNNAYTLVIASLAIHWARYMACECQRNERDEVPDEWVQMAMYYNLPFDNVRRVHMQYEGFERTRSPQINQSDTILLTYPLNWNMSRDIMRHDLEYYEKITSDFSPAMTWSFFTIGWKWVEEYPNMNSFFLKSYQEYIIQPFKIWTEFNEGGLADQDIGTVNFLPGMGGFMQSIIYGFAGIRLRPQALEFHNPMPPHGTTRIRLNGFKYLGNRLNIEIDEFRVVIVLVDTADEYPLVLKRNGTTYAREESLTRGASVTIDNARAGFYIYTNKQSGCEHPRDHIYMPWGYSPFIDGAISMHASSKLPLVIMLSFLYMYKYIQV